MSKCKKYVLLGAGLLLAAIGFILYALNNPQAAFSWNNNITYTIYGVYGVVTGIVWGLAFKHRQKIE